MRYRLIATFLGAPYQAALGPDGGEVTLFAACPPPEELGFSSAAGHWRKLVDADELDGLRLSRPAGMYRGERCLVLDDQGDRLHIAYLGRDASVARQLGYWEIDREVFEMVVPRADVTDLTEEQVDVSATSAMIPVAPLAAPPAPAPAESVIAGEATHLEPRAERVERLERLERLEPMELTEPSAYGNGYNGYHAPDRVAAWHGSPEPWTPEETNTHGYAGYNGTARPGPRTARRDRIPIQSVFAELLDLASIPQSAYAVDDEVPGAMCLLKVDGGYEVFASSDEARHEVRFFEDEEAAYFYLFGVLAAEAVRNGQLGPTRPAPGFGGYTESLQNVSKYLRDQNCPNSLPAAVRVLLAGGADGPPLPKQPRRPLSTRRH